MIDFNSAKIDFRSLRRMRGNEKARAIAHDTGISTACLSNYERGQTHVPSDRLVRLMVRLGVYDIRAVMPRHVARELGYSGPWFVPEDSEP